MTKILVVEDDPEFAMTLVDGLTLERFTVEHSPTGTDAIELLRVAEYDTIILDWNLPGATGIEVLRQFRANGGKTPVLMLTGKSEIEDKEKGFDTGADDYLTKPFHMRELVVRVRALLRRGSVEPSNVLRVRNIKLDPGKHRVMKGDTEVHILPRDFALLEFLMRNRDDVFSADALISRVWHNDSEASAEGLRSAIRRIRKALDDSEDLSQSIIENIARIGYRLRN